LSKARARDVRLAELFNETCRAAERTGAKRVGRRRASLPHLL